MSTFENENLLIFLDNLSPYHVFFDLISFFAFILTLFYCCKEIAKPKTDEKRVENVSGSATNKEDNHKGDFLTASSKLNKSKELLEQLSSSLSENELLDEQKVVKMQVEKIYEILRQQEEKFNVTSMDQVRAQLSLYR